jgi:hypothetical protein
MARAASASKERRVSEEWKAEGSININRVSGNCEGGDSWEELSRIEGDGSLPPPGGGVSLRLPVPKGGGPPPLGGGVEGWCYGQLLLDLINFVNVKLKLPIEMIKLRN